MKAGLEYTISCHYLTLYIVANLLTSLDSSLDACKGGIELHAYIPLPISSSHISPNGAVCSMEKSSNLMDITVNIVESPASTSPSRFCFTVFSLVNREII